MKLSEAIRLGAMLHPQTFGTFARFRGDRVVATCALGAAKRAGYDVSGLVNTIYRCADPRLVVCPACCDNSALGMAAAIAHLNDNHQWTRERIADWVETVERSLEGVASHESDKRVVSDSKQPVSA